MLDETFRAEIERISDPVQMLEAVRDNEQYFGYDPYYKEIRDVIFAQVETVIHNSKKKRESYTRIRF